MRERAEKATSIVFVLLGVAAIGYAVGYPPGARTIPIIVSAVIVLAALVQLFGQRVAFLQPFVAERSVSGPEAGVQVTTESVAGAGNGETADRGTSPSAAAEAADDERVRAGRRGVQIALWTIGLLVAVWLFGFVLAIPLYMFAFLAVNDRGSWKTHLGLTFVMGLLTYILIVRLLYLPWNHGWLFEGRGWL